MNIETKINFIIYGFVLMTLYIVLKEYKIIEGFTENIDSAALSAIASIYNDKVLTIDKLIVTDSIDVRNGKVKIDDNIVTTGTGTFGNAFIGKHPKHAGCAFGHKNFVGHSDATKDSYFYSNINGKNYIKSNGNFEFDKTKVTSFETNNITATGNIATGNIYLHGGINAKHVGAREYVTTHDLNVTNNLSVKNNSVFGTGSQRPLSIVPSAWGNERTYITTHDIVNNKMKRVGYIMPERRGNSNERTHWHHNES